MKVGSRGEFFLRKTRSLAEGSHSRPERAELTRVRLLPHVGTSLYA